MYYFLGYLLLINLFTLVFRGRDKRQAVGQKWRISENRLLQLCVLGGWLGGLLGMQLFRHKTVKGNFLYWFYGIVLVWIVGIVLWMMYSQ